MKKLLSIIIAFVFVFGAYSCGGVEIAVTDTAATTEATTAEQSAVFKPFKYGITPGEYMFSFDDGGYAVKYDVHSGKKSSVCPDPFCDHKTDKCPFFGITKEALTSIGDIVYYAKQDDSSGKGTVYSFDVNSGETKTVFARDGYITSITAYYKKLLVLWLESRDITTKRCWYWYDTETKETKELHGNMYDADFTQQYYFYMIRDDRIIWRHRESGKFVYYSTDLDGQDFREYDFGYRYGNYYKTVIEPTDDGREAFSLYVTFAGETEPKRILQGAGPILFYENRIVYFGSVPEEEQKVVHKYKDGRVERDESGGNVYVMNPDGSDAHLLFHTDEYLYGTTDDQRHPLVCGDYIGIFTAKFKNDETVSDDLIIANINTGEFVITDYK